RAADADPLDGDLEEPRRRSRGRLRPRAGRRRNAADRLQRARGARLRVVDRRLRAVVRAQGRGSLRTVDQGSRRSVMNAPDDLGAVFDEHVASEFVDADVDATMATMTDEPYVWHVPPLTGASGGEAVRRFYSTQFIGQTPADATMKPIARTVSPGRAIDHVVLDFTHAPAAP